MFGIFGGSEIEMDIDVIVFEVFKVIFEKGMIKDCFCFKFSCIIFKDDFGKYNF